MTIRNRRGYALAATMVIGFSSMIFLLALAQYLTTAGANQALARRRMELRAAAEAGVDYALTYLNDGLQNDIASQLNPATISLPANYLKVQSGTVASNGDKISVSINISYPATFANLQTWCSIYDSSASQRDLDQYWRVIESTASFPGVTSKTIRVIARPESTPWMTKGISDTLVSAPTIPGSASTRPYFSSGIVSASSFRFAPASGSLAVKGMGGPNVTGSPSTGYDYSLTITSNGQGSVESNASVKGNIKVAGNTSSSNVLTSSGGQVQGRVTVNGTTSSTVVATVGPTPAPTDNVLANADLDQGLPTRMGNNLNPKVQIVDSSSALQAAIVPAPAAPNGASVLPQLSNMASASIGSGNYTTNTLSTTGSSQAIAVGDTVGPTNVSRFFISDESGTSANAVSIDTSKFQNATGDSRSLQVWYSGDRPININIADATHPFQGLIYAPNATITTTGNGTFEGAVVGKVVNVLHSGQLNLRTDLSDVSNSSAGSYNSKLGGRFLTTTDPNNGNILSYPFMLRATTYEEK